MAKHALLSPSSADRWMTCPGSVQLSEGIVEEASSYADEGTAAHHLAATCLQNGEDAAKHVGCAVYLLKRKDTGEHFEELHLSRTSFEGVPGCEVLSILDVDEDTTDAVQVYLDYVRDVVASTGGLLLVEVSVPLSHMTGEEDAFGTSDAVIVTEDEVIVIDLKFGRGVEVSAENNRQMLMYASGALQEWQLVNDIRRVRMAISQPRISHSPSEWACDLEYLRDFEQEVRDAAVLVGSRAESLARLSPSEDACRWCKAKATCPALASYVEDSLGSDFDNLLTSAAPKVEAYDNDTLAKKMACIDLIELWCGAVRAKVESELLQGREVEGYKLVQGKKGNRAWTDEALAEETMKSMRLKTDEMYTFKLISPTKAEKILKENPKKWKRVASLIGQSDGKASVAPASDKRPALVLTPTSDDFDNIAEKELA